MAEFGDVKSLLSGEGRDFLLRNNGDKVSISSLQEGIFGIYFSASWCGPCRSFTPKLADVYSELSSRGSDFEVIFVSGDMDEDSFNGYFTKMPWLAIPFSDSDARKQLNKQFNVYGIPHLVILDANGKVLNEDGVEIVEELGVDGYPFTLEKHNELLEAAEAAKREQTLQSVLVSPSRDYVILNDGTKVPVSDLEGKIVAIYFAVSGYPPSAEFTPILAQIYEKLKEKGEKFEVVLVSLDEDESSFAESFSSMPWFALPFEDKNRERLTRYFELHKLPFVVMIGGDGKTMNVDFAELVEEHGVDALQAFPFDQEKLDLLADKARAKIEAKGWPEKMKHDLHEEHELVLLRCPRYCCDACNEMGAIWSYRCKDCDFDLHPECALKESKDESGEFVENHEETSKDGYVCDGDVCRKL